MAKLTESMAAIGRRDNGRGIVRRENDVPRIISANGTAIPPTRLAVMLNVDEKDKKTVISYQCPSQKPKGVGHQVLSSCNGY